MKKEKDEKIVRVMKKLRETYVGGQKYKQKQGKIATEKEGEQVVPKINNKYINIWGGEGREELEKR